MRLFIAAHSDFRLAQERFRSRQLSSPPWPSFRMTLSITRDSRSRGCSDDPRGELLLDEEWPFCPLVRAAPPLTISGPGFLTRSFRFGTPCLLGPRRV